MAIPPPTEHGSEILLLAVIGLAVCGLSAMAYWQGSNEAAAAWSTVLMAIISAVKERWSSRSIDRMGQSLANAPPAQPPAGMEGETK